MTMRPACSASWIRCRTIGDHLQLVPGIGLNGNILDRREPRALSIDERQPSAGGDIRTSMIIAAALIEGVTLFAEVVCIILAVKV